MLNSYPGADLAYVFAGKAGEAQRSGDARALVAELGANYSSYHSELTNAVEKIGGPPDRAEFERKAGFDVVGYVARGAAIDGIVLAEAFLRWCVHRVQGRSVATDATGPLVTPDSKLRDMNAADESKAVELPVVEMPKWG